MILWCLAPLGGQNASEGVLGNKATNVTLVSHTDLWYCTLAESGKLPLCGSGLLPQKRCTGMGSFRLFFESGHKVGSVEKEISVRWKNKNLGHCALAFSA